MAICKKEISLEDLKTYDGVNTVGELLAFIEKNNISMDAKICVERVEDTYYDTHNWGTVRKKGGSYWDTIAFETRIREGEFKKSTPIEPLTEEELESFKTEYTPIWCPVKYRDDDNLYLDLHY